MHSVLSKLRSKWRLHSLLAEELEQARINQGVLLSDLQRNRRETTLQSYEFKVFSQWGEDGILQFLTSRLEIKDRTFIEFGVEDFREANCRFLLMKDGWRGFILDGSRENMERVQAAEFYWRYPLRAESAFITRENIAELLERSGFDRDLGILSIDIDGVDYYVWERLEAWRPRIVVVEYNASFGKELPVSVPYEATFQRTRAHFSNLYFGASLAAFQYLAEERGYALVGIESHGVNAFFVRRDLLNREVVETSVEQAFREASPRESRDRQGRLTFLEGFSRREVMREMPLVNVVTGERLRVGDLPAD